MPKGGTRGSNAQTESPVYSKFDGGLNIRDFWHTIGDNELTLANNIRLDEGGVIRRRGGWTKLSATEVGSAGNLIGIHHGAWVLAGVLTRIVVATDGVTVWSGTGGAWTNRTGGVVNTAATNSLISFVSFNNVLIGFGGTSTPWTWDGTSAAIIVLAGSPPIGNMGIVWQNRVFFAGVSTLRTRLYYCALADQLTWAADAFVDIPSPYDGDEITGFAILYGNLIVFKRRSVYIVQGDAPENWVISKTNSAVGCISPYSVVAVDNLVYFVSDKGLYAMNLSNTKHIAYRVEPRYNAAAINQLSGSLVRNRIKAIHYPYRNEIWMAMDATAAGQDQCDRMLAHNYKVVDKSGDPAVSEYRHFGSVLVTAGTNDRIDFTENGGAEVSATLTAGTYSVGTSSAQASTLCAEVKTRMDAAGTGVYTVTYAVATDKMTIARDSGVFVIRFATGVNTAANAAGILGFTVADTASAISAVSNSTIAVRALATTALVRTAPAVLADYLPGGIAAVPIASFYDRFVYLFVDTATTDATAFGTAMGIALQFTSGYKSFGDTMAIKTLRNVWTSLTFAAGTPRISIGLLGSDMATETVATLTPSTPSTFYNTKQPVGQIYGSSPQGAYFKFGITSDDGGTLSFYELSFDIIWNGRRA